jgi:Ca2+-binding EF-hand superfamily protein
MSRDEIEEMFKEAHQDKHGQITYDEFVKMVDQKYL